MLGLPKIVSKRLILVGLLRQAADLVETQAARIRYDFEQRLQKNRLAFSRQLVRRIDSTVAGIEVAVEGGMRSHDLGAEDFAAQRLSLVALTEHNAQIESRIANILSHESSSPA